MVKLVSMSEKEYLAWVKNPLSSCASIPEKRKDLFARTLNVLQGDASKESVSKRLSFKARWQESYNQNPTLRKRVAIRNWGFKVKPVLKNERKNC